MEELDKIATAVDEHYKPEKTLAQKINELSEDKLLDIEFGVRTVIHCIGLILR